MRFVLCLVLAMSLPASAFAATKAPISLAQAQAAADKGDVDAQAALATTVDREMCMSECANRGHDKGRCTSACRPGLCHPGAEQPYCISR